jgi:hypothetical protein
MGRGNMKKILFICLLGFCSIGSSAQVSNVSFTNLNGFPDVIVEGQAYQLSGYIKNFGSIPASPSVVDVKMRVADSTVILDNNSNIGPLNPGDSIFWNLNGYIFPAIFAAGGQNDILIWPTKPSSSQNQYAECDTLVKSVYYSNSAGFRTRNEGIFGLPDEIELGADYALRIQATNEGLTANTKPISFYFQYTDGPEIYLGTVNQIYQPGDTAYFSFLPYGSFNIKEYIILYHGAGFIPAALKFWAQETPEIAPISRAEILLDDVINSVAPSSDSSPFTLFPNPATQLLNLRSNRNQLPGQFMADVLSIQGEIIKSISVGEEGVIPVGDLAVGFYLIRISADNANWTMPFSIVR